MRKNNHIIPQPDEAHEDEIVLIEDIANDVSASSDRMSFNMPRIEKYQEHYYVKKKPEKTVKNLVWPVIGLAVVVMGVITLLSWIILTVDV